MPALMLDSNVLISHLRTPLSRNAFLARLAPGIDLFVSVITRTEVLAGMHEREALRTMDLLQAVESLPVTAAIADRAGRWLYQYARHGVQLAQADALIAATAVEHEMTLVTRNTKHFPMPELRVQTWPDLAGGGPSPDPVRWQPI